MADPPDPVSRLIRLMNDPETLELLDRVRGLVIEQSLIVCPHELRHYGDRCPICD